MLILSQIARVYDDVTRYFDNNRAAHSLHGMSDAQLRDIGIARDQIDQLVFQGRDGVARKPAVRNEFKRPAFTLAATN